MRPIALTSFARAVSVFADKVLFMVEKSPRRKPIHFSMFGSMRGVGKTTVLQTLSDLWSATRAQTQRRDFYITMETGEETTERPPRIAIGIDVGRCLSYASVDSIVSEFYRFNDGIFVKYPRTIESNIALFIDNYFARQLHSSEQRLINQLIDATKPILIVTTGVPDPCRALTNEPFCSLHEPDVVHLIEPIETEVDYIHFVKGICRSDVSSTMLPFSSVVANTGGGMRDIYTMYALGSDYYRPRTLLYEPMYSDLRGLLIKQPTVPLRLDHALELIRPRTPSFSSWNATKTSQSYERLALDRLVRVHSDITVTKISSDGEIEFVRLTRPEQFIK